MLSGGRGISTSHTGMVLSYTILALLAVALGGCGGAQKAPTSAPTPVPTPAPTPQGETTTTSSTSTSTSTTTVAERMVDKLNRYYMSFDENDDSSKLGVTMSMAFQTESFDANMFCAPYEDTKCYKGQADCRLSASLYNHKMLLQEGENKIKLGLDRIVGYVFDQEAVEQRIGKCSSIFDAAAFNNYNGGCGTMAFSHDCADHTSAFYDICPSTGKTCTGNDTEVTQALCAPAGPKSTPKGPADPVCFFRGAAWDAPNLGGDDLRSMAKERLKHQDCTDPVKGPCVAYWNEVIIDNRLLLPALQQGETSLLWAFTYLANNAAAKGIATSMRDQFCKKYNCDPKTIPVIAVDANIDFTTSGGPFVEDTEPREVQVV